ncbi:putative membrane protein [Herbinix hemicellulosilytica]|uniref:Putative membrane protein n=1 Tax=Herbinix hemicellulosilytica TaxID=1564487 RepID=A0A0H5SEP4_HERHM|nr:ECF transporter S component [Herbinix hemicellulosilytica]RBP56422.1 putative membrane protein [Herbinix hemicellulosilytica]CRZ33937.1 putative membrane protein [Herbinix hemicellulosilytica]
MRKNHLSTVKITITALFMAMNIVLSSFSIPVPGGHLYLNDIVICLASILLNPLEAFIVGGIGAFLGDLLFYPAPMFVSLVTHGLQAIVISLFSHKILKNHPHLASIIGVIFGAIIMVIGYTLGRAFIYSTPEYALIKLPFQVLQAVVGAIMGLILCWNFGIHKLYNKIINKIL